MRKLGKILLIASLIASTFAGRALVAKPLVNYYYEKGSWLDVKDNIGDDKGPGYYQYPLDKRLKRGTFDLKRFSVYEEGNVITFVIQMRNYIMQKWPDRNSSQEQGFVANLWDIYIDIDGIPGSGYQSAIPGRDLDFSDTMGWEKMIIVSPLSETEMFDLLRDKTDELSLQNQISDIIYPDYIRVERDRLIIKISKSKLPGINSKSGYQCLTMGFYKISSPNRFLNRDVKAFPTKNDFGGGENTYGDPPVMDIIVPKGMSQYKLLRQYRSEPYREDIEYAEIPFVYPESKKINKVKTPVFAPVTKGNGFVPIKPVLKKKSDSGFKPIPKAPAGFMPVRKN